MAVQSGRDQQTNLEYTIYQQKTGNFHFYHRNQWIISRLIEKHMFQVPAIFLPSFEAFRQSALITTI